MAVESIYNMDICGACRRLNDFIYELFKSSSANVHDMNSFDQSRLRSYIAASRAYLDWVVAQPQLDLPETSPELHPLPPRPVVDVVENAAVDDCIRLLVTAREELSNSQSARYSSGLLPFDENRVRAVIDKLEALLETYISTTQPIDLPESTPEVGVTGPGRLGV
jgi:hypothetical protein